MAKENEELELPDEENLDELGDETDWKSKAGELQKKYREAGIRNRERTKSLKDKMSAVEKELLELRPSKEKPDDKLLERLDKMALQVAGIKEADEVELYDKWKEQTGRESDDIVGNEIFVKELESLRTAKAIQQATSEIAGGQDKTGGAKSTPEYWIAKATKGKDGQLEFPEETPKELYTKIVDKIAESQDGASEKLKFYNS